MKIVLVDINKDLVDCWKREFEEGENLEIVRGDIFGVGADAVVSPANSFGFMDGGLDLHIRNTLGEAVEEKAKEMVKGLVNSKIELLVGDAAITSVDHPEVKYMIMAPTMRVPANIYGTPNTYLATRAAIRKAVTANFALQLDAGNVIKVLAIPGMGTGVGCIPPGIAAKQMYAAYDEVINGNIPKTSTWDEVSAFHRKTLGLVS